MDKNDKKGVKRIFAIAVLLLILADIICLMANAVTGGDTGLTMIFLFFLIVVPAVGYIFLFFSKALSGRDDEETDGDSE